MSEAGLLNNDLPCVDIHDTGDTYTVIADVPGFPKDNIEVTIDHEVLKISGKRETAVPEPHTACRLERKQKYFQRSFSFPAPIDTEKVQAKVEDGVLTVNLTKASSAKPRRLTIE
jgi:HSP20 family molecular chaperone IbpA